MTVPRARGGISMARCPECKGEVRSPRTRGYFPQRQYLKQRNEPFPAHAGVFPAELRKIMSQRPVPRARGGISDRSVVDPAVRIRSPRTRGYFHETLTTDNHFVPFPAHAGVFPPGSVRVDCDGAVPRARGGISESLLRELLPLIRSPRTRGYFQGPNPLARPRTPFPAHAGVFPTQTGIPIIDCAVPRARGGISTITPIQHNQLTRSPRTRGYFQ